jgi:hypothetical protein
MLSSMMYEYILRVCCGSEGGRLSSPAKSQRHQDHRFGAMQMVTSVVEYECDDNLNACAFARQLLELFPLGRSKVGQ